MRIIIVIINYYKSDQVFPSEGFRRNKLSPSSGAEVTRPEEQGLRQRAPEDGNSMFLRNVGIDLQIHTTPKPKTSTTTYRQCVSIARVIQSFQERTDVAIQKSNVAIRLASEEAGGAGMDLLCVHMAAKSRQRRQTTEHDDGDDHVDGV
jgi:hypothetical protein